MAHAATYLRKLAEHYQTLAATMTFNKDRKSVETVAAEYREMADEAELREKQGLQQSP
jgi:hypothetical protein